MNVLNDLKKSDSWHEARRLGIGGSDAASILRGDWLPMWEEKTGRASFDLSDNLAVCLGSYTEDFNRAWFEKQTGIAVSTAGCGGLVHPLHGFMRANLDGVTGSGIFEAKHVSAFAKDAEIVERYYPQLQHCLAVTGVGQAYLSVIFGNHRWAYWVIEADAAFQDELIKLEAEFWEHVKTDTAPTPRGPAKIVRIDFEEMRSVDMTGSNEWAMAAADWLENRLAAKQFSVAANSIKDLVEPDVRHAFGHGVEAKRAKNGSIRIGEHDGE